MSSEYDYEYAVAVIEAPTYMGAAVLVGGIRILCGPCTEDEANRFIEEAVKDGALREHYHRLVRKVETWKECLTYEMETSREKVEFS